MRITGQETTNTARRPENAARGNEVSRPKSSEDVENSNKVAASDKVELSSQARDIQRAREVAHGAPETTVAAAMSSTPGSRKATSETTSPFAIAPWMIVAGGVAAGILVLILVVALALWD